MKVLCVGKTAAVKKTPRQAASSVEASGRPSFDIPVGTGKYQLGRGQGMTSLDDAVDDVTANNRLRGSIQSCELSTYHKYVFTLRFALGPRSLKFFKIS